MLNLLNLLLIELVSDRAIIINLIYSLFAFT